MKPPILVNLVALLALLPTNNSQISAAPLGTAFTYQGRLSAGPGAVTGLYDFTFTAWDVSAGGTTPLGSTNLFLGLGVTNGVFTVTLDFGPGAFTQDARWLEIAVRTNGSAAGYHTLPLRQLLLPAPQALWAQDAGSAASVASGAVTSNGIASGQVVRSLNGIHLNAADSPLIVRDWDPFSSTAPYGKANIGRWGLFMEPNALVLGIPGSDVGYRLMAVARYDINGTPDPVLSVGNDGITTLKGLTMNSPGTNSCLVAYAGNGHRRDISFQNDGMHLLVGNSAAAPADGINILEDGTTEVKVLRITGGSDLAEPFAISDAERAPKGSVMVIDDQNPGQLRISTRPYDKRVAGVISGAGGLNPGLTIAQQGLTDQGAPVALSGRVYTLTDTCNGPIQPGDMLTTSSVCGYAMKVTDQAQAHGAVIGKAMTSLKAGRGLVLVLVSLQ